MTVYAVNGVIQQMMDKLSSFESPEAIASYFVQKGVKGEVQDGDACVISNWFMMEAGAWSCTTTERHIAVQDDGGDVWEMIPNDTVVEFITNFDNGEYPDLVVEDEYFDY